MNEKMKDTIQKMKTTSAFLERGYGLCKEEEMTEESVFNWLKDNPKSFYTYLEKYGDISSINIWLVNHGYSSIYDHICKERDSFSSTSSGFYTDDSRKSSLESRRSSAFSLLMASDVPFSKASLQEFATPMLNVKELNEAHKQKVFPLNDFCEKTPDWDKKKRSEMKAKKRFSCFASPNSIESSEEYTHTPGSRLALITPLHQTLCDAMFDVCETVVLDEDAIYKRLALNCLLLTKSNSVKLYIKDDKQFVVLHSVANFEAKDNAKWVKKLKSVKIEPSLLHHTLSYEIIFNLSFPKGSTKLFFQHPLYNSKFDGCGEDSVLMMPLMREDDECFGAIQVFKTSGYPTPSISLEQEKTIVNLLDKYYVGDLIDVQNIMCNCLFEIKKHYSSCSISIAVKPEENQDVLEVYEMNNLTSDHESLRIYEASTFSDISDKVLHRKNSIQNFEDILERKSQVLEVPIYNQTIKKIGLLTIKSFKHPHSNFETDKFFLKTLSSLLGLFLENVFICNNLKLSIASKSVVVEKKVILSADAYKIKDPLFDNFSLNDQESIKATVQIFQNLGFIKTFNICYKTLCRFLLTLQKNYRNIEYHNWNHGFNVTQAMYSFLVNSKKISTLFSPLEKLALIISCLCHDIDHRGLNNSFQKKACSSLRSLYGDKGTMEFHHCSMTILLLSITELNILKDLPQKDYNKTIALIKHIILSTDLAVYNVNFKKFNSVMSEILQKGGQSFDVLAKWSSSDENNHLLLMSIITNFCDLSGSGKPWNVQKEVVDCICREFFNQGDLEKIILHAKPSMEMDRLNISEVPKIQLKWIKHFIKPLYHILALVDNYFLIFKEVSDKNFEVWKENAK